MNRDLSVEDLHKQYDPDIDEYDPEWDEIPSHLNDEDHFETLVDWAVKSLGFTVKDYSSVLERDYDESWTHYDCEAMGSKEFTAKLNQNTVEDDYFQHVIVERSSWSLEDDGRVTPTAERNVVLCFAGSSGDDIITVEEHELGKCPHLLYEHEVVKEVVKKVELVAYIKVKCSDEDDELDSTMEDAIYDVVHDFDNTLYDAVRDYVEDRVDHDVYYNGDMRSTVHKHKISTVKRMPR